jgi:hypothetical protein
MTSLQKLLGYEIPMNEVKKQLIEAFRLEFTAFREAETD